MKYFNWKIGYTDHSPSLCCHMQNHTTQISIAGGSFLVTFGKTIDVTDWSEIKYFYSEIYNCMLSIISAENISRNTKDFACTAVSDCPLSWMVRRQSQLNLVEVLCYHQEVLVFWSWMVTLRVLWSYRKCSAGLDMKVYLWVLLFFSFISLLSSESLDNK